MNDRLSYFLIAILAVAIIVNIAGLADYPYPHCDETGNVSTGYNLVSRGIPTMDAMGEYSRVPLRGYGSYYLLLVGSMVAVFGDNLVAARLSSTLGWLIATASTYLIGRKLFDVKTGLLASLIFSTSLNVYWASHITRQEIWIIAVTQSLIYFWLLVCEKPSLWGYLLLGIATAHAAIGIHPNGLFFSAGISVVVTISAFRSPNGRRWAALFLVGGLLGSLTVMLIHFLPDPNAAVQTLQTGAANHCGTLLCLPSISLDAFIGRLQLHLGFLRTAYWMAFNGFAVVFGAYVLVGLAYVLTCGSSADKRLLGVWGVSGALFALLLNYRNPMYAPLWDGLHSLFIAAAAVGLAGWLRAQMRQLPARLTSGHIAVLVVVPLIGINLASQLWLTIKFQPRDFNAYLDEMEDLIPPGKSVMGNMTFWFSFHQRNLFTSDWYLLGFCGPACRPSEDLASTMRELELDYAIDTGAVGCALDPTEAYVEYRAYLLTECVEVGQVQNRWFGAYGHLGQGQATTVYSCQQPTQNSAPSP